MEYVRVRGAEKAMLKGLAQKNQAGAGAACGCVAVWCVAGASEREQFTYHQSGHVEIVATVTLAQRRAAPQWRRCATMA